MLWNKTNAGMQFKMRPPFGKQMPKTPMQQKQMMGGRKVTGGNPGFRRLAAGKARKKRAGRAMMMRGMM